MVLVAGLDGVAEEVFAAGVSESDELFVPFYALRVDGADVVIADAFAYRPLVVLAWVGGVGRLGVLGVCGWRRGVGVVRVVGVVGVCGTR